MSIVVHKRHFPSCYRIVVLEENGRYRATLFWAKSGHVIGSYTSTTKAGLDDELSGLIDDYHRFKDIESDRCARCDRVHAGAEG